MELNRDYIAKVTYSNRELSLPERIRYATGVDAQPMEECCRNERLLIEVGNFVSVSVHNEKARDGRTDYTVYYVEDLNGTT